MKKLITFFLASLLSFMLFSVETIIPFTLNGKIGFVDENLKCVLEPQYDGTISSFSRGMVLIRCRNYYVLIGENGQLLTRGVDSFFIVDEDKYAISQDGGSGFSRVFSAKEKKVLKVYDKVSIEGSNKTGNLIIDTHSDVNRFNVLDNEGTPLFNKNTFKRIFGYDSEKQVAFVQDRDFNDCLVSSNGQVINSDKFQFGMRSFNEGYIFGKNYSTGESGFFDMECKRVIKAAIKNGSTTDDWNCYPSVNCGVVALVNDGEKNCLLSEWQTLHSDYWSIVDIKGKFLAINITADYIFPFSDDVAVLMVIQEGKRNYYLIDKNGRYLTEEPYDEIISSVNGYCMAKKNGIDYLISSKDGNIKKCEDLK